jgi:hypothetical protein
MRNSQQFGVEQARWIVATAHLVRQAFQGDHDGLKTLLAAGPEYFTTVARRQIEGSTALQFTDAEYGAIYERLLDSEMLSPRVH